MNTKLIVMSSGSIYATSGVIDLYEDIPISLNYSIADIKEPQKRNADYSKTIKAPGSNNNNQILSHIYEIGIDRLYNPNKKVEVRVTYDMVTVFKGYMRLAMICKLGDDKIEYDLEIRGRLDDLFTNLIDLKLINLNWTDLDHTYNETNIANSWSTPVGSNYVYPFIDYGYESNIDNISVDHLFPAVYIKEVWDRVFSAAGFQYSSSFLTSTFFKSLIMPFTGENMRLSEAQIQAREFQASRLTTSQTHIPFATSGTIQYFNNIFNDDSTSPNVDLGGRYNTATGIYTVPANGYYNFTVNIASDGLATPHAASQYINYSIKAYPRLIKNGVAISYGQLFAHTFTTAAVSAATASNTNPPQTITNGTGYITYSGLCNAGDTFYVDFQGWLQALSANAPNNVDYQIRLNPTSYFYVQVEPIIKAGDWVTFYNTLPQEMKIVDFLVSIIKMFNLYFEYDKDIPNKIHIEPRNDYYTSTIQDWSAKLDAGQELEIIPMGALNAKCYQFTYKKDGDVLNDIYHKTYGEVYGEKRKNIDNDFLRNTEKMELIFSPTPQYGKPGTNKFYPALYNIDASMNVVHNKSMNPRILYYGGMKATTTWYIYTVSNNSITYGAARTTYPYCGMMDDPHAPTVSLDFEAPFEVFYTPSWNASYSNNNLYNKYWSQFIDEITDYNSSIVTGWFWLSPVDVLEIDFRHIYRFSNQNFRLNKVYNYNPSQSSLTKCDFIKVKQGIPFTPTTKVIKGSVPIDGTTNSTRFPSPPSRGNIGDNSLSALGNIQQIFGSFNNVSPTATNVTIQGNANSIGTRANNIQIQNSSGCIVAGGLVNVSIMNSSGITVIEDNTVVENNVVIFSPSSSLSALWLKSGNDIYNGNSGRVGVGTSTPRSQLSIGQYLDFISGEYSATGAATIRSSAGGSMVVNPKPGNFGTYFNFDAGTQGSFFCNGAGGIMGAILGDGRMYGTVLHNNESAVTGTTNQFIASGTYTPTLVNTANITSSTAFLNQWIRVGNVVTVSGYVTIQASGAGLCYLEIPLPIASDFTNVYNLGGSGVGRGTATVGDHLSFNAEVTTNTVEAIWSAQSATSVNFTYTYTYLIL